MKLPKTLYVRVEADRDHDWLNAEPDVTSFDHGDTVGTYQLVETGKIEVAISLTKRPSRRRRAR